MQLHKYSVLLLLLITTILTHAQIVSYKADNLDEFSGRRGVFYALPMNYFLVEVSYQKVTEIAGPFKDYASELLGVYDFIKTGQEYYTLDGVEVSMSSSADPEQLFFLEYGAKVAKEERNILVTLDNTGSIVSTSFGIGDEMPPVEENIVKEKEIIKEVTEYSTAEVFPYFAGRSTTETIDTIVHTRMIDTSLIEEVEYKTITINKSLKERAEEALDMIERIRENRFNLITGFQEVAYEEGTIKYMDDKLKMMEYEYLAMFLGKRMVEDFVENIIYIPVEDDVTGSTVLFNFSETRGLTNSLSGATPAYLNFELISHNEAGTNNIISNTSDSFVGYFYRLPAATKVTIEYDGRKLYNEVLNISQFGAVTGVPYSDMIKIQYNSRGGVNKLKVK